MGDRNRIDRVNDGILTSVCVRVRLSTARGRWGELIVQCSSAKQDPDLASAARIYSTLKSSYGRSATVSDPFLNDCGLVYLRGI
eukprot:6128812-Pyramimonas_sp.AAC.2